MVAGLVPSVADELKVDRTVKKCVEIAKSHQTVGRRRCTSYGGLVVVNMFAKFPVPRHNCAHTVEPFEDLVGPANDSRIQREAARVRAAKGTIVVAWGDDGWSRHGRMLSILRKGDDELWCFGTPRAASGKTGAGFPNHASLRRCSARNVQLRRYA
jgi:hypothetical protein